MIFSITSFMIQMFCDINNQENPLLAMAIHNGHEVRAEAESWLETGEDERLKEEDPFTGFFTDIAPSRIVVNTSRFEVDLNRPREEALYKIPEQSWGMKVWKEGVPVSVWENSLKARDEFYNFLGRVIDGFIDTWGFIIIYDIHSYNFRRIDRENGDDPLKNPDINVGTGSMDRDLWAPVIDSFIESARSLEFMDRRLSVEENIRFRGGYLSRWVHENYPGHSCVPAIELKKIFMDEWKGLADIPKMKALKKIMAGTVPAVLKSAELAFTGKNKK